MYRIPFKAEDPAAAGAAAGAATADAATDSGATATAPIAAAAWRQRGCVSRHARAFFLDCDMLRGSYWTATDSCRGYVLDP